MSEDQGKDGIIDEKESETSKVEWRNRRFITSENFESVKDLLKIDPCSKFLSNIQVVHTNDRLRSPVISIFDVMSGLTQDTLDLLTRLKRRNL